MPPPGSRTIWPSVVTPSRASESRSFGSMSRRASGTALAAGALVGIAAQHGHALRVARAIAYVAKREKPTTTAPANPSADDRALDRHAPRLAAIGARSRACARGRSARALRHRARTCPARPRLDARRQRVQRRAQLGDRRFDLLGRHDARTQRAVQAQRVRVALTGQHAGSARALARPQHAALRSVLIDHDDRMRAQLGLLAPHELERQRREIEARDLHCTSVQLTDKPCQSTS